MNNINESSWSKDFDFIEESYGYSEPLAFTEVKEDIIVESEMGKPSTYKILGKASGVFQTVGGYSRNKRFYCPEHWKIQLDNTHVQERLAKRDIMGTLGHSADRPINDDDISKGLVSHLVTKLEIREDINGKPYLYGELEILDTPAGRILKALYEGGANLYVSSRGAGKLEPMPDQAGIMRVNPHSYWFEGFDMVRRPGFLEAKPVFEQVKESTNESVNEASNEEVDEAANFEKVRDCDDKICKVEKAKKEMKDKLLSYDGKPADIEYDKLKKNLKSADYVLKGLNKRRDEAANEEVDEAIIEEDAKDKAIRRNADKNIKKLDKEIKQASKEFDQAYAKKQSDPNINLHPYAEKEGNLRIARDKEIERRASVTSESELESLKSQLEKLAAVVEKVVDDVYEVPSKEDINKQIAESEQFVDFLKLMSETDVSEDVLSDIFHMIFNKEEK